LLNSLCTTSRRCCGGSATTCQVHSRFKFLWKMVTFVLLHSSGWI
jgi:hypothetical protein